MTTIIEFDGEQFYDVKQLMDITIPKTRSVTEYMSRFDIDNGEVSFIRPVNKQKKPCKNSMKEFSKWNTPDKYVARHDVCILSCEYYHSKAHQKRLGKTKVIVVHPNDRHTNEPCIKGTGIVNIMEDDDMALLDLDEEDLFVDESGTKWTVETRGKREPNKCFFSVSDLAKCLKEPNLRTTIAHKATGYELNVHYVHYKGADNTTRIFVNHLGLNKIAANGKTDTAKVFAKWVSENLYVIHSGTNTQKTVLAQKLITKGIQIEDCPDYFNVSASPIAVIYNFDLGSVEQLEDEFGKYVPKLDDPSKPDRRRLIKFGRTNNIKRRSEEHIVNYPREKGYSPVLIKYWIIEEQLLPQAECEFDKVLIKMGLKVNVKGATEKNGKKEIAIYTKAELDTIYKAMDEIQKKYGKGMESVIELLRRKDAELALSAANNVISTKDHELKMAQKIYEMSEKHHAEMSDVKDLLHKEELKVKEKDLEIKDLLIDSKSNEFLIYKLQEENKALKKKLAKK